MAGPLPPMTHTESQVTETPEMNYKSLEDTVPWKLIAVVGVVA